jgi:hypothetical protein
VESTALKSFSIDRFFSFDSAFPADTMLQMFEILQHLRAAPSEGQGCLWDHQIVIVVAQFP